MNFPFKDPYRGGCLLTGRLMRLPFSMSHALTPAKMERDHGSADGILQTPSLRLEIDYQGKPAEGRIQKNSHHTEGNGEM